MALLDTSFNIEEMPEGNNYDPIPAGDYIVNIVKADIKATKDGTGQFIALQMDVLAPSHAGRKVFSNINVRNKSTQAEEIGRQQLGSIMRACGLAKVTDTDELLGQQILVKVIIEQQEGRDPQNVVRSYKAVDGANLPKAENKPATTSAPTAAPWAKRASPF